MDLVPSARELPSDVSDRCPKPYSTAVMVPALTRKVSPEPHEAAMPALARVTMPVRLPDHGMLGPDNPPRMQHWYPPPQPCKIPPSVSSQLTRPVMQVPPAALQ